MTAMVDELQANLRFALAYGWIALRNLMAYRAEIFVKLAGYPARLVLAYFLWRVLLGSGMLNGYGFTDVLTYYLVTFLLTQMYPFARMSREIRNEIYSGDVVVFVARGVPHWAVWLGRFLATACIYLALVSPVAVLLIALLGHVTFTIQGLVGFITLTVLGLIVKGQLWYLIGISSYFTEENMGTIRLYELLERLLSGAILPVFLFPAWVVSVQKFLPFMYTLYVPVNTLLHAPSWTEVGQYVVVSGSWCIGLALITRLVFESGWRRFTGHGI